MSNIKKSHKILSNFISHFGGSLSSVLGIASEFPAFWGDFLDHKNIFDLLTEYLLFFYKISLG